MEDCKHLEAHTARFESLENSIKTIDERRVSWVVFVWAIGLLTTAVILEVNYVMSLSAKISTAEVEMAKVQTKLVSIETLLVEIKGDLKIHDKE